MNQREVYVWYALPEQVVDPWRLERCRQVLSPDERARQQRLLRQSDRHLFLVAHALVRDVLSRCAPVEPAQWRFAENAHGKPRIVGPPLPFDLQFNLTHTEGLVACAVAVEHEVGVDAERVRRPVDVLRLSRRFFSAAEAADLARLPGEKQSERFFDYWTLKEAYVKALGGGLSIPLRDFTFHLPSGDQPGVRIELASALEDEARCWQFTQFSPTGQHKLAVAVRRGPGPDLPISLHQTQPFAGEL